MTSKLTLGNVLFSVKKSIPIALVVGTFLTLINQSDQLSWSTLAYTDLIRMFLNYLTPLLVASYSRFSQL